MFSLYNLDTYTVSNRNENDIINNDGLWFARRKVSDKPLKYTITKTYKPVVFDDIKQLEKALKNDDEWFNMRLHKGCEYKLYGDMDELKMDVDDALEHVKSAYEKVLNIKINNLSYTTNDEYKKAKEGMTSHHYVFPEFFATLEEQEAIKNAVNEELKQYNIEIDPSVYCERWFRLPNQKKGYMPKKGYENGKHRVEQGRISDFMLDYINKDKMTKIDYVIETPEGKKTIINKSVKTYSNINHENEEVDKKMVQDLLNILDAKKRSSWKLWADVMLLLRNFGLIEMAHEFSKKMPKYDPNEINRLFSRAPANHTLGIGSLKYWAMEDNPEAYEKIALKYQKHLTYTHIYNDILLKDYKNKINIKENTERITEEVIKKIVKAKTSIVMSCTGSGKTTMVKQKIIDAFPKQSVISVSCIRSLAKAQEGDFGLTSYLNGKVDKRTIISYEQINKRAEPYDIVILDEVTSLLKHIKSTTMKKKRDCHLRLTELVKGAKKLIACDAIMTDVVFEFIKDCRGDDILFYQNTYKRWEGITVNIVEANNERIKNKDKKAETTISLIEYKDKTEEQKQIENKIVYKDETTEEERIKLFITPLMETLETGKTCAIVSDSKRYINKAREMMINHLVEKKIMTEEEARNYVCIFTSDHGKLENINAKFFNLHCIMFSPKIVFGVNIDESVNYDSDSIYVIYKGKSIDCTAMLQQLGRFRGAHGVINLLWVRRNYIEQKNKYISPEEIKERELVKINSYIQASKKLNDDMEIIKELGCNYTADKGYEINDECIFSKQYFRECWYDEILSINKNQPLESLLEFYGYTIKHSMLDAKRKTKNLKKCIEINDREEVINNCMKYINGKLSEEHEDYELIKERIDKKLEVLGHDRKSLNKIEDEKKRKMITDIVVDDEIYRYCIKSSPLFISDADLKKKFKKFDIYKTIDIKNKNPATLALIKEIERITEIKRFEYDTIKEEHFEAVKKYFEENKLFVGDALYGFSGISKKLRESRIKNKLESDLNNIEGVRKLMMNLYNQYAPLFENRLVKQTLKKGEKHERIYKVIKNEEVFEHLKVFNDIMTAKNTFTHITAENFESCFEDDELDNGVNKI